MQWTLCRKTPHSLTGLDNVAKVTLCDNIHLLPPALTVSLKSRDPPKGLLRPPIVATLSGPFPPQKSIMFILDTYYLSTYGSFEVGAWCF